MFAHGKLTLPRGLYVNTRSQTLQKLGFFTLLIRRDFREITGLFEIR